MVLLSGSARIVACYCFQFHFKLELGECVWLRSQGMNK